MEDIYIGDGLKKAREGKGVTQAQAAEGIHVSETTFAKWERNERPCNNREHIQNIVDYFGISVKDLGPAAAAQFKEVKVVVKVEVEPRTIAESVELLDKRIRESAVAKTIISAFIVFVGFMGFTFQGITSNVLYTIICLLGGTLFLIQAKTFKDRIGAILVIICGVLVGSILLYLAIMTLLKNGIW